MSNDPDEARRDHIRSVTITATAAIAGILAAVLSAVVTADLPAADAASDMSAYAVLLLAILIQIPLYRVLGFDEFGGGKDVLFIAFMSFALWFVTYGIILTMGVEFV